MKINNIMANSVELDETARNESSHLDLHYLQRYIYWSAEMKLLKTICDKRKNVSILLKISATQRSAFLNSTNEAPFD